MERQFTYHNKKSVNNGQVYSMHMIDAKVYLTPIEGGKTKVKITMPYLIFRQAIKDGFYTINPFQPPR